MVAADKFSRGTVRVRFCGVAWYRIDETNCGSLRWKFDEKEHKAETECC